MITFLTVLHVIVCLFLVLVVLLQAGKGGGMGIAFGGGGGSQTVFGSSGAGNFLTRLTSITAFLFLLTSLGLAHFSSQQDSRRLQRLAERKTAEKKADDARAEKLKIDLEKARESVQKTAGGAAAGAAVPVAPATSEPTAPVAPRQGRGQAGRQGQGKTEAKTTDKPAADDAQAQARPAGRRRSPAPTPPAKTAEKPRRAGTGAREPVNYRAGTMPLPFVKAEGTGNDFVVVDLRPGQPAARAGGRSPRGSGDGAGDLRSPLRRRR